MISRRILVLLVPVLLAGCPEDAPMFDRPFRLLGPFAVGGRVAYVEQERAEVHLITPALTGPIDHDVVRIGHDPEIAAVDLAGQRLLVLTHGTLGAPGVPEQEQELYVIEGATGATKRFDVGSPFTAIALHPDAHRALLHFDQGAVDRPELVFNANEVAIVDLDSDASDDNPRLKTVRSFEQVPTAAVFSPELRVAGEVVNMVAILTTDFVTLLDIDHLDRREVSIPLTLEPMAQRLQPTEVVFHQPDPGVDPVIYVSATGSTDVFAFTLRSLEEPTDGGNQFSVAPNMYAVSLWPTDLEPVTLPSGEALLVATGSPTLWVVDALSSEARAIGLSASAHRIAPVRDASGQLSELLLYSPGGNVVHVARLQGLQDAVPREVDSVALPAPIASLEPLADGRTAAVFHADANRSLSILRLEDLSVAALTATAPLDRTVFSADGATAFVAATYEPRLSFIDVSERHPEDLRLDAVPTGLLLVPGRNVLVVTHASAAGLMTFVDSRRPARSRARMLDGFLLEGLLDSNGERR